MKGQLNFDGVDVGSVAVKFTRTLDIDDVTASKLGYESDVTFVVTGRVVGANFKEDSTGLVQRVNNIAVTDARVLEGDLKDSVEATLQMAGAQQQIVFDEDIFEEREETVSVNGDEPPPPLEGETLGRVGDNKDAELQKWLNS